MAVSFPSLLVTPPFPAHYSKTKKAKKIFYIWHVVTWAQNCPKPSTTIVFVFHNNTNYMKLSSSGVLGRTDMKLSSSGWVLSLSLDTFIQNWWIQKQTWEGLTSCSWVLGKGAETWGNPASFVWDGNTLDNILFLDANSLTWQDNFSILALSQGTHPDQDREWDSRVGFKIPYTLSTYYSILTCITWVNGREFQSTYFPRRISKSPHANTEITGHFLFFFIETWIKKALFVLYWVLEQYSGIITNSVSAIVDVHLAPLLCSQCTKESEDHHGF